MLLMYQKAALTTCLTIAALTLTGCGGSSTGAPAASGTRDARALDVVAAFYPLQFVTERVAGDRATVTVLTAPGTEPHDLELSAQDVATLGEADLLVYESGFQAAVDDAVESEGGDNAMDVSGDADLDLTYVEQHEGEAEPTDAQEVTDPHFWLDPTRLAGVVRAVSTRLAEVDPEGADTYAANAEKLTQDLGALDAEFEAGLAGCTNRTLVTSHEAFGYLAQRYDLEQLGISGLSPEAEPDAGRLAEISDFVRAHDVRTIYFETLVSPALAETVATETGAATAVLDPLEGLTDASAGTDYLEVQRANLASLRIGQSCP